MSNDFGLARRVGHAVWSWVTTQAVLLTVGLGALLVLLGAYFGRGPNATITHAVVEGLKAIGTAALAGGIFAWLTKTAQLSGAIREELEQTIYSQRHLRHRKDIKDLWIAATRALHEETFQAIDEKLYNAISKHYLPTQNRFYYRIAKRVIELKLIDRDTRVVRIISHFEAELVPDKGPESIKRPMKFNQIAMPAALERPEARCQILHPETRALIKEASAQGTIESGNETILKVELEIDANDIVLCSDKALYYQSLNEDNWITLRANTFVDGMSVDIHFDPRELVVQHQPIGNISFFQNGPQAENCIKVRTNDLIFARLGIMISMQVVDHSPSGDVHA